MSEELVTSVQEKLKEETWTRAAISNYTQNQLIELDALVRDVFAQNSENEVKAICDEQLANNKDSIIALYLSGMISLKKGALDNSALETLVDIFQKNHKETLVTFLCKSIRIDFPTNKFALRTLASIYREHGEDDVWDVYTDLVKVDLEEADAALELADHYKAQGNTDKATEYYKKALLRYVNNKNSGAIDRVWKQLIELIPEEIDFFMLVQRQVAKTISPDKSESLLWDLYADSQKKEHWDTAIDILKLILAIDQKDARARSEIAKCYQAKYAAHSNVEKYIRSSNLTQSFRNVFEAINDFEKHIAFDVGHYVFHRTWHVGVIQKVENDKLCVNFGKKTGVKELSLKMAVDALQPLDKEHIWVITATQKSADGGFNNREDMIKKIKNDKVWTLKTIIKSFNNSCDLKKIKAELVRTVDKPGATGKKAEKIDVGLLKTSEWTSWSSAAKKILETDATFGVNPNNINEYMVRDRQITAEEKLNIEFKAQKQFFARIDILMRYLNDETTNKESDLFNEMVAYFNGYVKSFVTTNDANEQVVASYLVMQKVQQTAAPASYSFEKLYRRIENPREMYTMLKDTKNTTLRKDYLNNIKSFPDMVDQYVTLFPAVLEKDLLDTLIAKGETKRVQNLAVTAFDDFRGYRDAILYFFANCREEDWFKEANIPYLKQLIALLNIISHAYREINSHVDTTENRKVIRTAITLLFNNDTLLDYMLSSDEETMTHLYTLVDDIDGLDSDPDDREIKPRDVKPRLRAKILEKYPDYKFHKTEERTLAPKGMLVTRRKLKEKQDEETDLQTVQIPRNSQEVAEAKAKGDLSENAEYQAAKEHQHYLGKKLAQLQSELARAVIFDPTTATTSYISFGTTVTLANKDTGKDESYTILGPWESDTSNGIISYMSPFGNELLDHKVGDDLDFTINGHEYKFTVKAIKLAKF